MKHVVAVCRQGSNCDSYDAYDVNVMVLIHNSGIFSSRIGWMKQLGLINLQTLKIHITLVASLGDGEQMSELLEGWPMGTHVTVLEMASACPLPKIHSYYLWLRDSGLTARWHLRVDDDSVTDLFAMFTYAESRFRGAPIHLMTSPLVDEIGPPLFSDFLARKKIILPSMAHEYECSMTSQSAMNAVLENEMTRCFLEETGEIFDAPGDRGLAIAMHMIGIPGAVNPIANKDFEKTAMTLAGGRLAHIHYVNWRDDVFTDMLAAFVYGEIRPVNRESVDSVVGRGVEFGRCIGEPLRELHLVTDGTIANPGHHHETSWHYADGCLFLKHRNGSVTSILNTLLLHRHRAWIFGPYMYGQTQHYLRIR
jgi:hypothetical protein